MGDEDNLRQKKTTISTHLAFLSIKYSVDPAELFHALVMAKEKGKSMCENLSVEYRGSVNKEAILLIKKDNKVLVQFRVTEELLSKTDIHFEKWMETDKVRKQIAKQKRTTLSTLIRDLRTGMKKVNVEAEVLETQKPSLVHTQFGNSALVANALIADETGKITLCLWGEHVTSVAVGDTIQIKNASVSAFRGERQLRLGKSGTLSVSPVAAPNAKQICA
jgi:replication factor A1